MSKAIEFEKSSGNVFRDLGVKEPDIHLLKAQLGVRIIRLVRDRKLTQVKASGIMGISQPELSRLKGGILSHYSVERLMGFLNKLDQRIEIRIKPSTKTKAAETVLA